MGSESSALTRAHHRLGATLDDARFHGDAVILGHVLLADVDINVKAVHVRWIARRRAALEVVRSGVFADRDRGHVVRAVVLLHPLDEPRGVS